MPVQRLVLVRPQLVDNRLDAQHQKLVAQMQSKLQILLARSVVQHGVNKRHDGRLQIHIVPVRARRSVQIVDDALESCALRGESLEVQHRRQHLLVAAGHQTDGAQNFERRHFGFDVVGGQRLGDGVDARRMGENV